MTCPHPPAPPTSPAMKTQVLTCQSSMKNPATSGMTAPIVKATHETNAACMHVCKHAHIEIGCMKPVYQAGGRLDPHWTISDENMFFTEVYFSLGALFSCIHLSFNVHQSWLPPKIGYTLESLFWQ